MYAVIRYNGKQHKVSSGSLLELEGTLGKKDDKIIFEDILLTSDGEKVSIGKPLVSGVKISGIVLENKKGEKIRVSKFKAKARYRKTIGFRQTLTVVKIDSLGKEEKKEEKNVEAKKTTKRSVKKT